MSVRPVADVRTVSIKLGFKVNKLASFVVELRLKTGFLILLSFYLLLANTPLQTAYIHQHHHHHHKRLVPSLQQTRSAWQYKSQYNRNSKLTAGIKKCLKMA